MLSKTRSLKKKIWQSLELLETNNDITPGMSKFDFLNNYFSENEYNTDILVCNSITEHQTHKNTLNGAYKLLGVKNSITGKELDAWLHVEKLSYDNDEQSKQVKRYLDRQMSISQDNMRKAQWIWRIGQEAAERQKMGWYPFFITLTLDPKKVKDTAAFWREGKQLYLFIRSICNKVTDAMGHARIRRSKLSQQEYIVWQGHLEHGKSREHHHMHIMAWLRDCPSEWKIDPNQGIAKPENKVRQRCKEIESIWKYSDAGRSQAIYWRCIGDAWASKHGFCTPVVKDKSGNSQPLKLGHVRMAGAYMAKYLTKDEREWNHRVRGTRGLGTEKIIKMIQEMPDKYLRQIALRPPKYKTAFQAQIKISPPMYWLRKMAKDEKYHRDVLNGVDQPSEILDAIHDHFSKIKEYTAMGMKIHRMSQKNKYKMLTEVLPKVPKYYSEKEYNDAIEYIAGIFPAQKRKVGETVSLGGMEK